jgi:monoamine oxidase
VEKMDAVVVGAGFAGLVATRELAKAGHSVTLVEARDRWGGRAWSKPEALDGQVCEMGANWLEPEQHRMFAELERYGVKTSGAPGAYGLPAKWHLDGELREGGLPFSWKGMVGVEQVLGHLIRSADRIDPTRPLSDQDLDDLDITLDEFFAPLQLEPFLHEMAVTQLAQSSTANTRESSVLHPLRLIASAGTVYTYLGGGSDVLVPSIGALQDAIAAEARESGARFVLSSPVRCVSQTADGVTIESDSGNYEAKTAVLALSSAAYASLKLDGDLAPLGVAMTERSGPDRNWSEGGKFWAVVSGLPADASGAGTAPVRYFSVWGDASEGEHLVVGFTKGLDPIDPDDIDQVQAGLRDYYPEAKVKRVVGQNWLRDRWTGATWPGYPVGWIKRYEKEFLRPHGRVVFAGSDIAVEWPTNMEGGLESGFYSAGLAKEILA